jgi:hypothetical protein
LAPDCALGSGGRRAAASGLLLLAKILTVPYDALKPFNKRGLGPSKYKL